MRREGLVYPGAVRKQGFARVLCIWISAVCAFPHTPRSNHPLFNPLAQERGLRFGIAVRLVEGGDILFPIFFGQPGNNQAGRTEAETEAHGHHSATAGDILLSGCRAGSRAALSAWCLFFSPFCSFHFKQQQFLNPSWEGLLETL